MIDYVLKMMRQCNWVYDIAFRSIDYTNGLFVSKNLKANQRSLTKNQDADLRVVICAERTVNGAQEADIDFELYYCLNAFRATVIPWLSSVVRFNQLRVLEVG